MTEAILQASIKRYGRSNAVTYLDGTVRVLMQWPDANEDNNGEATKVPYRQSALQTDHHPSNLYCTVA